MAEDAVRADRVAAGEPEAGASPRYEAPQVDDLGTLAAVTGAVGRGTNEFLTRS